MHCSGGPTKLYSEEACTKRRGNSIARLDVPPGKSLDHFTVGVSTGHYACNHRVRPRFVYHWPLPNIGYDKAWFMHASCAANHYNALFGRVGLPIPRPVFRHSEVVPIINRLVAQVGRCWNIPYGDIVAGYRGKKRLRYNEAWEELVKSGDLIEARDARVNMFIKQEAIGFDANKPEPDCRAIQFRSFKYTLYLASRIRMAEKGLYSLRDVPGMGPGRIVAKGLTDAECAQELHDKYQTLGGSGVKIYGFDLSRCDAHINPKLLAIEQAFFKRTNPDSGLAHALRLQLNNQGSFGVVTDSGFYRQKYKVRGERMSGDSNTSGGTCAIVVVLLTLLGETLWPGNFAFLCNGDDSSFMFRGAWVEDKVITDFFLRFGLTVKIDLKTEQFEHIEFCQSKPVYLHSGWTMVRNPERVCTKLGITNKSMPLYQRARYVRTVALGELSRLRGCPVIQPFLLRVIRDCEATIKCKGEKVKLDLRAIRDSYRLSEGLRGDWMSGGTDPITEAARQGYALSWGVPPQAQLLLEQSLLGDFSPTGELVGREIQSIFPATWTFDWNQQELYNVSL